MTASATGFLPRRVQAEVLDELRADDPRAVRSRRDLQRVNRVMATRSIFLRALREAAPHRAPGRPIRILELGCGDGTLMLGVAGRLGPTWVPVELTLLDRQDLVAPTTLAAYGALDWRARGEVADVFAWAQGLRPNRDRYDLIVANLFLHHFEPAALQRLLAGIAGSCDAFFACEPRRAPLALAGSHLIGALGVNSVTREDAVLSVHAGFRGSELSALWLTGSAGWQLREYGAGLFSHCLLAQRQPTT